MEAALELDPLTEFLSAMKNPLTRDHYQRHLSPFFQHLKLQGTMQQQALAFVRKAKSDHAWATYQINDYMRWQRERAEQGKISEATLANFWKPIKLLCEESDILLNWKKILRRIPKGRSYANDRKISSDQIRTICSYPDPRIRAVALIMSSSGCRIGAFDYLNVGHVEPIEKKGSLIAAKITIYAGTNDEYMSFLTPEAYNAVKSYIEHRKEQGERISKDSPAIRDLVQDGDRWGKGRPNTPIRLKSTGVKRLVEDALKIMGLRKKLPKGKKRYEFPANHAFRKFFKSQCELKMKSLIVETLLGHDTGLAQSYYRPSEQEILDEYLKAIPDLEVLSPRARSEGDSKDVQDLEERLGAIETRASAVEARLQTQGEKLARTMSDVLKSWLGSPALRPGKISKEEVLKYREQLQNDLKRINDSGFLP